jgi:3-oxoacyl-[acyl-carrier protein] reductase
VTAVAIDDDQEEEGMLGAMNSISGKIAIVTGASTGIGRAIAERLADEGATVVVNYGKSVENARSVVAGINAKGGRAIAVQGDVSKIPDVRRLIRQTAEHFGRLDILVNNAARIIRKPLMETSAEEFDQIFALNARGSYFAMQEAAKIIEAGGRIVNISTSGTHEMGLAGVTAYLGSKAALELFTKGLALELGPAGVTVNTVSPGFTDTAMLSDASRVEGPERSPFERLGTPADIANAVLFLVSDQASWLTGQNIQSGGGVVM